MKVGQVLSQLTFPDWVHRFLEYGEVSWQSLVVTICTVAVPACVIGASVYGSIFKIRREEAKGLLHRTRSGFSEISEATDASHSRFSERKPGDCLDGLAAGGKITPAEAVCKDSNNEKTKMTAQSEEKAEGPDADQPPPPQPEKAGDDDDGSDGDTNAATGGDMAEFSDVDEKTAEEELVEELEAAPLHLHTLRIPPRLRGTSTPVSVRSRSSSRSRSRSSSRDVSPSPHASAGGHKRRDSKGSDAVPSLIMGESTAGTGTGSSAASVASIEDIDPDILHDQKGLEDLTPPPPHEIAMGPLAASPSPHTSGLLPSVNERMSEETLDDCHAFNDLTSALHTSLRSLKDERDGADGDGCDGLLATLAENEDEDEDEEGSSDHGKEKSSALTKENLAQLEKQETEAVVVAEVAA